VSNTINFGIDLGTTNSLIAKFDMGTVEVFQDSIALKQTLPSIVGFRKDRILIGDKAKEFLGKDSKSVVGSFKLDMGTTKSFPIHSLGQSKTPVELSAFVLKQLKTFIHTGEEPQAVVITIPASFNMVQSNATKKAGHEAGFKQVVLLQEPIAASLAYANKEKNLDLKNSQWIVYDFGGGTFDLALIKIAEGELKVVDHEGDNYLGGSDFDALIVEKLVIPQLEKRGHFTDLATQMKSEKGRCNRQWYVLLRKAEEAKIELSSRTSAEIEIVITDDDDNEIEEVITVTRSEFEAVVKDTVDSTAAMLKKIVTRNSLRPQDLQFILMVGGSTYIPFVRKRVEELLGIPTNTGINPTNAIVIGAAYYAATKEIDFEDDSRESTTPSDVLGFRVAYDRATQDSEVLFAARVEGDATGLFYRITRNDGGYDSGLMALMPKFSEDLPLQIDAYNHFSLNVYDEHNNPVLTNLETIQVAQGKYSAIGQPLPEDLSLVLDDIPNGGTCLKPIFLRNAILPSTCKRTQEASKTLIHGSDDEIRIMVVEGPSENHYTANVAVGYLIIPAKDLKRDIHRGTDIDLKFTISESRELAVEAYVTSLGQEFSNSSFVSEDRSVPVEFLREQIDELETRIEQEQSEAIENQNYEVAESLKHLLEGPVKTVREKSRRLDPEDVTSERHKLERKKRRIAQDLGQLTAGKRIELLRAEYQDEKTKSTGIVSESGNDSERRQLFEVISQEHVFLNSTTPQKIEEQISRLSRLSFQILLRTPDFLLSWFHHLAGKRECFNDQVQAQNLIEAGKRHIAAENYEQLAQVNFRLHELLPQRELDSEESRAFGVTMGIA
jgi:molecular chaperone DnaK